MTKTEVLIVEDHATLRGQLVDALSGRGMPARGAADGRQAMHILADTHPRVLVTDIFMPDIEGLELIRMARALRPDLKIIAISGGNGEGDMLPEAIRFGADATLQKPFGPSELAELIAALMTEEKQPARQAPNARGAETPKPQAAEDDWLGHPQPG